MRNILYPTGKATYIDKKAPIVDQASAFADNEAKEADKLMVTCKKKRQCMKKELTRQNM